MFSYFAFSQGGSAYVTVNPFPTEKLTPRCDRLCISGIVHNDMPVQRCLTVRFKVPDALLAGSWNFDGFVFDEDFDEPIAEPGFVFLDRDFCLTRNSTAPFALCGHITEHWQSSISSVTYKVYAFPPTEPEPLLYEVTENIDIPVKSVRYVRNPTNPALPTTISEQIAIYIAAPNEPYGMPPSDPNSTEFYVVEAALKVDQSYQTAGVYQGFLYSEFIMRPNASVTVLGGATLEMNLIDFHGCEAAWQGIDILQNAEVHAIFSLNVSHADTATSVMPGGKLLITALVEAPYSTFRGNYTTFKARGNTNAQPSVSITKADVTGDGILCSATLNNCSPTFPFNPNQYVLTGGNFGGISNQGTVSNTITLVATHFRDMQFGVTARNANVFITAAQSTSNLFPACFFNILPNANGIGGTAIDASGTSNSTIRIIGNGRYDGDVYIDTHVPLIEKATWGIRLSGRTHLHLTRSLITNVDYGIWNYGGVNRSLYLQNNNIIANIKSIYVNQCTGNVTIKRNRFGLWDKNQTENCYFGGSTMSGGLGIVDNVFHGNDENIYLNMVGNKDFSITENTFNPFSSQTGNGYTNFNFRQLVCDGNTSTMIGCNTFREQNDGAFASIGAGLRLRLSSPTEVTCNEFWDKAEAIQIIGANTATNIIANRFNNMSTGIKMWNNAHIGIQNNTGNRWIAFPNCGLNNPPANRGGKHFGTTDFNILNSQFRIETTLNGSYKPSVLTPNITAVNACTPGAAWFVVTSISEPTLLCPSRGCEGGTGSSQHSLTGAGITDKLGLDIATGNFTTSEFPTSQTWTAEYQLFSNLMRYPDFIDDAHELTQFVTDQTGRNIEAFYLIERDLQRIATPDSTTQAQLTQLFDDNNALFDSMDAYFALMIDSASETQYRPHIEQLLEHIGQNTAQENILLDAHAIVAEAIRATAAQANRNIIPANLPETNLRLMNMIRLEVIAAGIDTFTTDQLYNIFVVANQCPDEGGPAVFFARPLWKMYDQRTTYDDDALCRTQGQNNLVALPNTHTRDILSISPNPSRNTELTLQIRGEMPEGAANIVISNLTGKELQRTQVQFINNKANLTAVQLPQGAYICMVELQNGRRITTLLQVIY